MIAQDTNVDVDARREVVEGVARTIDKHYVFPDVAMAMHDALVSALAAHEYDDLTTPEALCDRLTSDLQAICKDKHVRVRYSEKARLIEPPPEPSPEAMTAWIAEGRSENFGFYKVERLDGNVGYLDFRTFWEASLTEAGETAVAAMNFLTHTDALIIDLRRNTGGAPSMIALLSSFLFGPEPVHLNSFYDRAGEKTRQTWTLPYVPGKRTPKKPVYVLTSSITFSAAEEFTYNLKNLKRATIIGETTGGGAHPGDDISVTPHFRVFVPTGRAINPISGTNWEGTGIEPDIAVPASEALDHAYRHALKDVLGMLGDASTGAAKSQAEEARAALSRLEA